MDNYELIKKAVSEAMRDQMKDFYVERETHYNHHQWIAEMIDWQKQCKSAITKTAIGIVTTFVIGLIALGFIFKYKG